MAYKEITEINITKEGMDGILCYVSEISPVFFPMFLLSMFAIISMVSYSTQKKLNGKANIFASFSVAGIFTFLASIILTLSSGTCASLINAFVILITFIVMILSVIMFLMTKDQ